MSATSFLEQLANTTHYDQNIPNLLNTQSVEIKNAYSTNDSVTLKKQISGTEFLANNVEVTHQVTDHK